MAAHTGLTNAWGDVAQCMPPGMPPSITSTCPVIDSARQNVTTCAAISCVLATRRNTT